MRRILVLSSVLSILFAIAGTSMATAEVPPCTGMGPQRVLFSDQGSMESVTVGGGGSIYVSGVDLDGKGSAVYSYTHNGPKKDRIDFVSTDGPGGLAWDGRRLLWGYGNLLTNGTTGDLDPKAGLYRLNLKTGKRSLLSGRLGMANGIARGKDGSIFASNVLGSKLDRIAKGVTTNGWATIDGANGLAVSRNGKYLYANQMLSTPSKISRIEIADPANVTTYFTSPEPANVLLDGLARDNRGNLYAAAFATGEIWKIDSKKRACVLATGLKQPTAVAISFAKKGYRAGNLYAVGFGGEIVQVKNAVGAVVPG